MRHWVYRWLEALDERAHKWQLVDVNSPVLVDQLRPLRGWRCWVCDLYELMTLHDWY